MADKASEPVPTRSGLNGKIAVDAEAYNTLTNRVNRMDSSSLVVKVPSDPSKGINVEAFEDIGRGGPFYPHVFAYEEFTFSSESTWWNHAVGDRANDEIQLGRYARDLDSAADVRQPSRSATSPGILMINGAVRQFTSTYNSQSNPQVGPNQADKDLRIKIVDNTIWAPDGPTESTDVTRLLLMRIDSVNSGAAVGSDRIKISFHAKKPEDLWDIPDWKDSSGRIHFPMGWITVGKQGNGLLDDDYLWKWVVEDITWGNSSWVLQGGGNSDPIFCYVYLKSATATGGIGDIYYSGVLNTTVPDLSNRVITYSNSISYVPAISKVYVGVKNNDTFEIITSLIW